MNSNQSNPDAAPVKKGRGGARPGAGRKPKKAKTGSQLSDLDLAAVAAAPVPDAIETVTQPKARAMVDQLVKIMRHGKSDTSRVNACNKILDRGYGKPTTEAAGFQQLPLFGAGISAPLASELRDLCREQATEAVETLKFIAENSESESARVNAAASIIDRSAGSVAIAKLPQGISSRPVGKREEAQVAAAGAATGKFATPRPPRSHSVGLH